MMTFNVTGFDRLRKQFADLGPAMRKACEVALASTAKMIRNTAKDMARGRGAYGFVSNPLGWRKLSDYTGTISAAKGARREGFFWAKKTVKEFGWAAAKDVFIDKSAWNSNALSRQLTKEMKRQIRISRGQKLRPFKVKKSRRSQPLAKLLGFVRSRLDLAAGTATIGFYRNQGDGDTDTRLEGLVAQQAQGMTTTVTPRMRRFFWGIGFPAMQSSFRMPPRPWFGPVFERVKGLIPDHFRKKFDEKIGPFLSKVGSVLSGMNAA